jgi:hypothetical protein
MSDACECAANASLAVSGDSRHRSLWELAAQWRAMAARAIFLEPIDHTVDGTRMSREALPQSLDLDHAAQRRLRWPNS